MKVFEKGMLLIGVLALAGIGYMAFGQGASASTGISSPVVMTDPSGGIACNLAGNPATLGWVINDKLNKGTQIGGGIAYWSGEVSRGTQAAAFTVNPGETYKIYTIDNATYYGSYTTGSLDCATNPSLELTEYLVGTPNFKAVKNSDGSTLNAAGTPEPIGVGQTVALSFTIETNVTDAYSTNPEVNTYVISVMGNGSATCLDASKFSLSGCTGMDVPSQLAGTYVKSWACTGALKDWENRAHTLVVGAKAACNPNENMTVRYDDMTYYIDGDDGLVKSDTANENDADLGQAFQIATIYTN